MKILMRVVQEFDPAHEREFFELEEKFARLETRPEFPKGRRWQLIAGADPAHTLIWESEFESMDAVQRALDFIANDPGHEALAVQQRPYFRRIRIELLRSVEPPAPTTKQRNR